MGSARGDHARKVEYFVSLLSMPYVPVTSHVPLTLQSPVSPLKIYWKISAKFPQPAQTFHCLVKGKQPATGLSAVISNCYYTQPSLTRFFDDFSHTIFQMEAYCMKICRDTLPLHSTKQSSKGSVGLSNSSFKPSFTGLSSSIYVPDLSIPLLNSSSNKLSSVFVY